VPTKAHRKVELIPLLGGPWHGEIRPFKRPTEGLYVKSTDSRYLLRETLEGKVYEYEEPNRARSS
jgi:hypothetical protein